MREAARRLGPGHTAQWASANLVRLMQLFALNSSQAFGERVAAQLGITLAVHEEREFEDGEHKARPMQSVRHHDVYVIQSLFGDDEQTVNDKICRLLFFLGTLRDHGAARITAVVPYLAYMRKDRQTKSRDPVTSRYMALLLEAVGVDAVMTLDVHNVAAFQNAFRCPTIHLESPAVFGPTMLERVGAEPVIVVSPDPGGVKRAQIFQEQFEAIVGRTVGSAFIEKRRSGTVLSGSRVVGSVAGATVLIIDDMISTGGTMVRAAQSCVNEGANKVYALAAHGLFVGEAAGLVSESCLAKTIVADTIPTFRLPDEITAKHLEVVSAAPLFASAIRRCHEGRTGSTGRY